MHRLRSRMAVITGAVALRRATVLSMAAVIVGTMLPVLLATPASAAANAIVPNGAFAGFTDVQMGATDDGSWPCGPATASAPVACPVDGQNGPAAFPFGFGINFYGTDYSGAYINTNGNITFGSYLSAFTPSGLASTGLVIIAPFFADVDTRAGNTINIGTGLLDGHNAFVVNWPGVGCYNQNDSVTDDFQLILIDRPDLGTGPGGDDFQIEFNYNSMQWDAGQANGGDSSCTNAPSQDAAVAGFSNSTGDTFQLPGSQDTGALLDSNATTGLVNNDLNSDTGTSVPPAAAPVPGRYIFNVENGQPITPMPVITADVTGSQTYGSSSPVFTQTNNAPPGVTVSGSVSCATVNGGETISASLDAGSYAIDGSSCSGLSAPAGYTLAYAGGTFAVGPAAQSISFTAPATGTVGGAAALTATGGGSGNPVVFSVDAFLRGRGVRRVRQGDGQLHRRGQLRDRRQPGRQRQLHRRAAGQPDHHRLSGARVRAGQPAADRGGRAGIRLHVRGLRHPGARLCAGLRRPVVAVGQRQHR